MLLHLYTMGFTSTSQHVCLSQSLKTSKFIVFLSVYSGFGGQESAVPSAGACRAGGRTGGRAGECGRGAFTTRGDPLR